MDKRPIYRITDVKDQKKLLSKGFTDVEGNIVDIRGPLEGTDSYEVDIQKDDGTIETFVAEEKDLEALR